MTHPTPLTGRRLARLALLPAVAVLVVAGACSKDSAPVLDAQASRGKQLTRDRNCDSCHSADGSRKEGPTWKGLYGSQVKLANGQAVTADDAYIIRSIREPAAQVTQGFNPMVVNQKDVANLTDDDLKAIIAYIKALK